MSERSPWHPTPRRLADAFLAALAPVAACVLALGGLTAWTGAGRAGSPARITVSNARVLLPYGDSTETAAFFDITNAGGANDRLVRVTSSRADGEVTLSRHRGTGSGAAAKTDVDSAVVLAGRVLTMAPHGLDVNLRAGARWRAGDLVPFTLHFERGGAVEVLAVVIRPSATAG
ncbi:copper(I)-binding protein [Streptomyces griseochromogenes]|uniref:Copper(I)-binding protein n=1 Tax=Streptomyces griseochromogenes TaxID=68214 RepID=A0A1B1B1E5_9ACTN|nr:copper chaperone PCu(A)C [Streptomyces griseochromogenes]ANP52572.1 hypothetical protein AVL59_26235 [Streptomyces griseochromogenes]MBP2047143.1 copper(I)-binding protein [Streptomyces griseochromogenes]